MSSNVNTTRRRLDFGRKRNAPVLTTAATSTNPNSRSSSASFTEDICTPQSVKEIMEFYASAARLPGEEKTVQQEQDEAQAHYVRDMVAQGHRVDNAADVVALIRPQLEKIVDEQLKSDEWMFSGVPVEREV